MAAFDAASALTETARMPLPAHLIPPAADLPDCAAGHIVDAHRGELPDLSRVILLLPSPALLRPLRQRLQRYAGGALLGPQAHTLSAFARARGMQAAALSMLDCRLLLARELENYTHLFGEQDALALADEFLGLFEELGAAAPELAADENAFVARIERAYRAKLSGISQEARLVHTLWRAFLQQTEGRSPAVMQAHALQRALGGLGDDERAWLIGFDSFSGAEAAALRAAPTDGRVQLILQGRREGRDGAALAQLCAQLQIEPQALATSATGPRGVWLDAVFAGGDTALRERIPPTAAGELPQLQAAASPEHEARMADVAIRQWLLEGHRDIAVITQDRRYARRLRALLERANVPLRDEGGWALSTSTATASLIHWIDVCEQGFAFRPLLELLKSVYFDPQRGQQDAVRTLELAIYRNGAVAGLAKLMQLDDAARDLLKPLEAPARKLAPGSGKRPAHYWCENLLASVQELPLWEEWQQDAAGRVLAQSLEELHAALKRNGLRLSWADFRRLLEHTLERATFSGEVSGSGVRLLTLEQTQGLRCDALVLAGAAAGKFPGQAGALPLFNHAVRAELGLPHWTARHALALARFRNLLQAAPRALLTWAPDNEGEPAQPCAWAEALLACGAAGAPDLAALAGRADSEIAAAETGLPLAAPAPRPRALPPPEQLSAHAHQSLINCPYQFHAAYGLGLRALEEPDEPYSQRDFGERVHMVLAGFERQQPGLPPPFGEPVNLANAERAAAKLAEIGLAVFAEDLRARAMAQAWHAEFVALIPRLTGWLMQRGGAWPQVLPEEWLERELAPGLRIKGRVDRLERNARGEQAVVDYKTGQAPRKDDIESGEDIQATHYALLAGNVVQVEYLSLKRDAKEPDVIDGETLVTAQQGVRGRLIRLNTALKQAAAMPAQGDETTCEYCDYRGICRKGAWADG